MKIISELYVNDFHRTKFSVRNGYAKIVLVQDLRKDIIEDIKELKLSIKQTGIKCLSMYVEEQKLCKEAEYKTNLILKGIIDYLTEKFEISKEDLKNG